MLQGHAERVLDSPPLKDADFSGRSGPPDDVTLVLLHAGDPRANQVRTPAYRLAIRIIARRKKNLPRRRPDDGGYMLA